jgi:hypothetical protein
MDTTTLILIAGGAIALLLICWMMLAVLRGGPSTPVSTLWPPTYFFPERTRAREDDTPTGQFRIPTGPTGIPAHRGATPSSAETAPDATFAALPVARPGMTGATPGGGPDEDQSEAPTRMHPIAPGAPAQSERSSIEDTARLPRVPRGVKVDDRTNLRPFTADDLPEDDSPTNPRKPTQ